MGKKNRTKKGSRTPKEKANNTFSSSDDKKKKFGLYEIYKNATQSVKVNKFHAWWTVTEQFYERHFFTLQLKIIPVIR